MRAFFASPRGDILLGVLLGFSGVLDLIRGTTTFGVVLCLLAAAFFARAAYRWRTARRF